MTKEKKVVVSIVYISVCQECGQEVETEKEYATGFVCNDCLEMAEGDYNKSEEAYQQSYL